MNKIIWIWSVVLTITAVSCSKYEDDIVSVPSLSFSQVKEKGIEGCMEYYTVPGCAWAVLKDDRLTTGTAGKIFDGSNNAIEISHHFQIGSLGKSFTALMAAKSVEGGLILWDSKIIEVLPEWKEATHPAYWHLTLTDLLSHQTKLPPLDKHRTHVDPKTGQLVYEDIPNFTGSDQERRKAFCQYALSLDPVETESFNYGTSGYSIAGCMLEKVSGKTWEELAFELASSMDMEIGFERPNRLDADQPWGHIISKKHGLEPVAPDETSIKLDPIFSPAGDLHVSIVDFSKYITQYMKGLNNINGVVSAGSFKHLLIGRDHYAMGWYNDFETDSIFYHYGSEGTFYCHMMIFANLHAAIIIFTNAPKGDNTLNFINDSRNLLKEKYIYKKQ